MGADGVYSVVRGCGQAVQCSQGVQTGCAEQLGCGRGVRSRQWVRMGYTGQSVA